ncbi:hypothetical protein AVEN_63630-1, partial [Araneus ventricosus]
ALQHYHNIEAAHRVPVLILPTGTLWQMKFFQTFGPREFISKHLQMIPSSSLKQTPKQKLNNWQIKHYLFSKHAQIPNNSKSPLKSLHIFTSIKIENGPADPQGSDGKLKYVAANNWGPSKSIRWKIYKTIIESIVLYGTSAWAKRIISGQKRQLSSVQRRFLLNITGAYSTTSTAVLQVTEIAGAPPRSCTTAEVLRSGWSGPAKSTSYRRHFASSHKSRNGID